MSDLLFYLELIIGLSAFTAMTYYFVRAAWEGVKIIYKALMENT